MSAKRIGLRLLDAAAYAVVLTAVLFVAATVVSVAFGRGLNGTKALLFVVGFALFGYSSFRMRPTRPGQEKATQDRSETRFQRLGRAILPEKYVLPPDRRFSPPTKLFLASVVVLLTSMAMEFVFGVRGVY